MFPNFCDFSLSFLCSHFGQTFTKLPSYISTRVMPRGLRPDTFNKHIWDAAFRKHRERVHAAKPRIDNAAPNLNVTTYAKWGQLKSDCHTLARQQNTNLSLNMGLNGILRTSGYVRPFQCNRQLKPRSKIPLISNNYSMIEKKNEEIGKRLLCMKSKIDCDWPTSMDKNLRKKRETEFIVPIHVLSKYDNLRIPESPVVLKKLLRPKIFFDLEVKDVRKIGRVVIELFTEACPQVVLEFVRVFSAKQKEKINFIRLFPSLWMEGELKLEDESLATPKIEYDMRALDHSVGSGILSFSKRHLKGFRYGFIDFVISFKKLNVLNGKRIAFGNVLKGHQLLECLQHYGSLYGKPTKEIIVANLGII